MPLRQTRVSMLGLVETRSVSPVFVGRTDELGTLNDALARAAAGEPQALLLGGEAGVGKTRLVEEFATAACRRGAVVALGGCVEIGADGLPFAPFSTALRALRRELPDELAAAAAGQEEELARLLPELGETGPGRHDEEGMARLFELTARLLERVAADRTVVVVLEDLHWADASTRHLLAYLFRTLRTGRLVVLATYRADDIHRRHPLRPLLAELDRLRTVRRIELGRFNRAEVARQIAGILASEPDPVQVDDIFERSDGNAFFVEELAVAAHEGSCTGLTDSLRDLLLVRVEGLPESAQRIARIVAEGGSTVEYRLLAAVARLAEDDLIEALRAAVGANILLAAPGGDGYRFRHSLVREAVSDDLLPGERSRLNRRYAEALEADPTLVPAGERVMRLASYWYHSHDAAKALPAVLAASVTARRRHAYSEQLGLLERAMELWDTAPEDVRARLRPVDYTEVYPPCGCDPATTPLRYLDLMAEAAVAGRLCGERERALKIIKRALRLLDDEGDPLRAAWFWTQRSRLVQAQSRGDGWAELATAQDLVRGLPPSEVHAEVLAGVANWSMVHAPGPDAFTAAERAVEYARMLGVRDTEMNARLTLGGLMVEAGDVTAGLAEMSEVKDRTVEYGISTIAGRAYVNLPDALESVGRSKEAVPVLEEGIAHAQKFGLLDTEAWISGQPRRDPVLPGPLGPGGRSGHQGRTRRPERQAPRLPRHPPRRTRPRPRGRGRRRRPSGRRPRPLREPRPRSPARPAPRPPRDRHRRGRGSPPRRPRRTRTRPGRRLPARHPALCLADAARLGHRRSRRARPAHRRPRPPRDPRTHPRHGQAPGHPRPTVAGLRTLGPRRAAASRGRRPRGHLDGGRHRLRGPGAPLRSRPRPAPPGRGPPAVGGGRRSPGTRHATAAPGPRRRRTPRCVSPGRIHRTAGPGAWAAQAQGPRRPGRCPGHRPSAMPCVAPGHRARCRGLGEDPGQGHLSRGDVRAVTAGDPAQADHDRLVRGHHLRGEAGVAGPQVVPLEALARRGVPVRKPLPSGMAARKPIPRDSHHGSSDRACLR
ncbi:hypothetical protein SALBM311S_01188 [Streptomyces alboniger]